MQEAEFITLLWLIGILAEAMTGALCAGRKQMDLFGVVIIGCATAIGGGTLRDILLGNYPLIWVENIHYLLAIAFASLLTVIISPVMRYLSKLFLAIDALGLAVFSIVGAQKTLLLGFSPTLAIVMGVVTGVFGGVIRDILCNQVPLIFKKELYALVSLTTASLYMLLRSFEVTEWVNLAISLSVGFSFRMLAIRYHWGMPKFDYQHGDHGNQDSQAH
ncbi:MULTISPECIES: trimeric intracellular cation channel family protein [Shewanella]|uniref:trimeric intracellular cation channel family protein n=1 Tax=Shewanella TaxID=22 RepID=UPI001C65AF30|nr:MULTISPECIES: trimeric intracellular cation channel family protein [Shewanella]QYJ83530.1 trimeric intracellular cation channel family protein [Shewanella aegiceratis]QYJ88941.1 trimeric intracellular cation channel family protein [Shewanella halotolerans]QYJ94909.1 trimeric intracellular cation channel family protein [Shewanella spartinae]QYK14039.1 trimeric intracellular cation channel family protein [Shewanella rhizosphaerae]